MDQHAAWNAIGNSFDATRQRTWAHVDAFLESLPPDARVLDLMCGNGRHMRDIGLDWSAPLCHAAAAHGPIVRGDAARLPFADSTFDACNYVAGLHGLPDPAARAASLAELARVLRRNGVAQITVWSRDAPRFQASHPGDAPLDVVVPWRRDGLDVNRTYHLYTADSLRAACQAAGLDGPIEAVQIAADTPDNLVATVRPAIPR